MLTLTILTGLAFTGLLLVLAWGLARILQALQGIEKSIDKIQMGVRAIEVETAPLLQYIDQVNQSLSALVPGLQAVGERLALGDRSLLKITGALRTQ